jgi:hypothetical protein
MVTRSVSEGGTPSLADASGWCGSLIRRRVRPTRSYAQTDTLPTIEAEILAAPYRKQEAMNICLVEIGTRQPAYTKKCMALGERLGRFDPRPVPKGCTSPYAPEWIAAVLKRKK